MVNVRGRLLSVANRKASEQSLKQSIRKAISQGAPLYNQGKRKECYEVYLATAYSGLSKEIMHENTDPHTIEESEFIRQTLSKAVEEATKKVQSSKNDYDGAAWVLRRAFDRILKTEKTKVSDDDEGSRKTKQELIEGDGSTEKARGAELANLAKTIETVVEIKDRRHRVATYAQCFVGKEAVTKLVKNKMFMGRDEAVKELNELIRFGLLYHVTKDHKFKDEKLFYKLSSLAELRLALDKFKGQVDALKGTELVHYAALLGRYKQFHKHPSLGVLRLDYSYPPAPGDIDHPDSYEYPVYYRVVPGLTFAMCQSGKMTPEVETNFDEAVLWLSEHKDVSAITGDCGFMMWFIERARSINTRKPIVLSALMHVPTLAACCSPGDKIIVMTANGKSLDPMLNLIKRQVGIDTQDTSLIFVGCEDVPHFGEEVEKGLQVNVELAMPGVVARAKQAIEEHPDARYILMECTELPPYSDAVREATRLPVFDSITCADSVMAGFLDNQNFGLNGWYEEWDGKQEAYVLGQNLSDTKRLQCVWCTNGEFRYNI